MKTNEVIENIVLFILIGFLCFFCKSGWPCLLILMANRQPRSNQPKE